MDVRQPAKTKMANPLQSRYHSCNWLTSTAVRRKQALFEALSVPALSPRAINTIPGVRIIVLMQFAQWFVRPIGTNNWAVYVLFAPSVEAG
jgi:hypothetical protein